MTREVSKEAHLISQVISGNKNLFVEVIRPLEQPIYRYCFYLLGYNHHDAEDVAANTFAKVYINLAAYNPKFSFSSWVYRIAHNEAINYAKKLQRGRVGNMDDYVDFAFADSDYDLMKKIGDGQLGDNLVKVLGELKRDEQNILILFYIEERSLIEISDIMKITKNNAAVKLKRARDKAIKIAQKYVK